MTTRETQQRIEDLEATIRFLARGLQRALSGQARFTLKDTERLLQLAADD